MTQPIARRRLAPVAICLLGVTALWGIGMGLLGSAPLGKENAEMDEVQPVRLEAGHPVERELGEGATHQYLLSLEAGRYVRVAAEQKGADVVLSLIGPDGAMITRVDSPTGERGFERVSEVAAAAGEYRFEVSLSDGARPGAYGIRIEDLRPATDRDRRLVGAERTFAGGDELRREKKRDEALARYRQALEVWEADGGPEDQARALYRIGWMLQLRDQWEEAEGFFNRAIAASRTAGDRALEAVALNRLGTVQRLLGRYEESRASHEQALEAHRSNGNRNGEKDALNNLGIAHSWAGRVQAAVEAYEGALALARQLENRAVECTILQNLGQVYLFQGKRPEARDAFEASLKIAQELGDDTNASDALTYLGETEAQEGRFQQAREALERALDLRHRGSDRRGEAITLNFLGTVLLKAGDPGRAGEHYERALEIFRELGDLQGEATVLVNLGRREEALRDFDAALSHYGRSRDLFERLQDREGLAMARFGAARALARQGDLEGARRLLETSLEAVESLRNETRSLSLRTSFFASKQHYWELYVDVLMGLHEKNPSGSFAALALQATERRRFRNLLDVLTETRVDLRRGIAPALLEEERSLQQRLDRTERMRLESLEAGDGERAEALERDGRELLRKIDLVRARIREKNPRFADLVQPETVSLKQIQAGLLGHDDLLLAYSLGEERSFVWAVSRNSFMVRVLEGRERIDVSAERFHELLTRPGKRAKSLRDEAAADLAELVLAPVADRTAHFTRLLIVADGALQKVPFAALPLPGEGAKRLVVERHEIVLLPSASVLSTLRREAGGKALRLNDPWVAVLADPVFQLDDPRVGGRRAGEDPGNAVRDSGLRTAIRDLGLSGLDRLPHTRREAEAIEKLAKRKEDRFIALDFEADRRLVTGGRLRDYRVLHFATHSIINDRQPELSGLVLSLIGPDGRPQEGFLRLHEIYNLDLKADLVVLSACQTGVGREIRGEGMAGIVRGFMYAGVPGVVVSLWDVDDAATAELMSRFYEYLLEHGQRPATALRRAQLDMLRSPEWSDPELWAGFVFLGDPAIRLGGDIEAEDTGGAESARKAGSDLPPPKIAPDDDVPPPF